MQQNQLSRIQMCASILSSNEVKDHLQLLMKNFSVISSLGIVALEHVLIMIEFDVSAALLWVPWQNLSGVLLV